MVTGCSSFKMGQRESFCVGGRCHPHRPYADEIMICSVLLLKWTQRKLLKSFTALIQQEVILVTELLRAACDVDVLLPEKILKAHDLRLEREKVISSIRSITVSECLLNKGLRTETLMIKEPRSQIQPSSFKNEWDGLVVITTQKALLSTSLMSF